MAFRAPWQTLRERRDPICATFGLIGHCTSIATRNTLVDFNSRHVLMSLNAQDAGRADVRFGLAFS